MSLRPVRRARPALSGGRTHAALHRSDQGPRGAHPRRRSNANRHHRPSDLRKRFYPGLAAAAGIELGHGRLRWLPEFRYTRWTANIAGPSGPLRFNPNQAEFLLGLRF